MDYMVILIVVLVGFLFLIMQFTYSNQMKRKCWRERFQKEWGTVPEREYDASELEKISRYFFYKLNKGQVKEPYIDDITWNDLDMDSIFIYANHAKSSPGEEYLYYLLRTPVADQKILDERERLMKFFQSHEKERTELEVCFAEIGRTRKFAISDYVDLLLTLKKENNFLHYVALGTIPIGLLFMTVLPEGVGFLFLIALLIFDITQYYKRKGEIDPYLTTFSHIMKMLDASKSISELRIPEVRAYTSQIEHARKQFRKFERGSIILMSRNGATGSLEDALLDFVRMVTHIDLLKFNSMLEEVKKNVKEIDVLVENIGVLDALISAASFRESLPLHGIPEFVDTEKAFVEIWDVYHPLIAEPVANSISEEQSVLLTGSNASGKSTFLKTVAINAIIAQSFNTCIATSYKASFFQIYSSMALQDNLQGSEKSTFLKTVAINAIIAQSFNTCIATSYKASFFQIYSSMALQDNLQGSESYFIVEIKSLKRILSHAKDKLPMLCFVDEVLRGTNTLERIAASSQILKSLTRDNVLCFAATHDLELTQILEEYYSNYHFQEEIRDNDVLFNYQLYKGRAVSRNAIKLLRIIGYDHSIIENAENTAAHFLETGEWRL